MVNTSKNSVGNQETSWSTSKLKALALSLMMAIGINAHAQVTVEKVIDLKSDTNTVDVAEANKWLHGQYSVVKKHPYGSEVSFSFDKGTVPVIWELQNVKSRKEDGETTQYLILFTDGGKPSAVVSSDDEETVLTRVQGGIDSGCGCVTIIAWDDDGSAKNPQDMESN